MIYFGLLVALLTLLAVSRQLQISAGRTSLMWRNPYAWFVVFWIAQMALLCLPLLDYETVITGETAAFILASHVAFVAGTFTCLSMMPKARNIEFDAVPLRRTIFWIMLAAGTFCQILLSISNSMRGGMSVDERLTSEGVREARNMAFDLDFSFLGSLFGPVTMVAALIYVAFAYYGFYWGAKIKWARSWGLPSFAVIFTVFLVLFDALLLVGGRGTLVFVAMSFAGPAMLGRSLVFAEARLTSAQRVRKWAFLGTATISLLALAVAFQQFRSGKDDPIYLMNVVLEARPNPLLLEAAQQDDYLAFALLQSGYISGGAVIFDFYLGSRHHPGPFFGRYNFPAIYRTFGRFLPGYYEDFWFEDRKELFKPLEDRGRLGNVWATLPRDLVADFGRIGALFALFMFGATSQLATDLFYRRPTPAKAGLLSLLWLVCLWSAFHSLFFIVQISWALFWLILIVLADAGLKSRRAETRRAYRAT